MAKKPRAIILDSWSVLAYLEDEPAGEKVADIITDAQESGIDLIMATVNAGEVWYIIARETSEKEADSSIAALKHLGIEFTDIDWKTTRQAAVFKSKHKMSFADCFAAALAKERGGELVTGDHEFRQVAGEIKIHWLQRDFG
jgi:ribonuclease VapC